MAVTSIGAPSNPSYISVRTTEFATKMNFLQRCLISVTKFLQRCNYLYFLGASESILRQLFDTSIPSLTELVKNTSLILATTHFTFLLVIPLPPSIVEICGISEMSEVTLDLLNLSSIKLLALHLYCKKCFFSKRN